jgi:hypothetical protein
MIQNVRYIYCKLGLMTRNIFEDYTKTCSIFLVFPEPRSSFIFVWFRIQKTYPDLDICEVLHQSVVEPDSVGSVNPYSDPGRAKKGTTKKQT